MSRLADQGRDSYEEPEAIDIVRRIVRALRYCHSVRRFLLHRGLHTH